MDQFINKEAQYQADAVNRFEGLEQPERDDLATTISNLETSCKSIATRKKTGRNSKKEQKRLSSDLNDLVEIVDGFIQRARPTKAKVSTKPVIDQNARKLVRGLNQTIEALDLDAVADDEKRAFADELQRQGKELASYLIGGFTTQAETELQFWVPDDENEAMTEVGGNWPPDPSIEEFTGSLAMSQPAGMVEEEEKDNLVDYEVFTLEDIITAVV